MRKRPPQIENLLEEIRTCIKEERYVQTHHAFKRQQERKIELPDALYVLKEGYHEKRKTKFDDDHHTWNYAIRGKTKDNIDARVIVTFYNTIMIIITVMHVLKEKGRT